MKKYRLLKDLPSVKAGAIFVKSKYFESEFSLHGDNTRIVDLSFPASTRSEWLEEVEERWRPKDGEEFFYLDGSYDGAFRGVCGETHSNSHIEDLQKEFNIFRTIKECQACAKLCLETRKKYTESLKQE